MAEFSLTPQQQAAVESEGGTLLVSAAAGSGKTKVLVDRLLRYVCREDDPCHIDEFLIITYTRAAAAELRGKIAAALQKRLARDPGNRHLQRQMHRIYLAQISTVHAFCAELLRRYAYSADLPVDFRVAEENACSDLRAFAMEKTLESAYAELEQHPDVRCFIDTLGSGRNDKRVAELIGQTYDKANCQLDPDAWMDQCLAQDDGRTASIGDTMWGRILLDHFHSTVESLIQLLQTALTQMTADAALHAKYQPAFQADLDQLTVLAAARTWDEICAQLPLEFVRSKPAPKDCDAALKERMQAARREEKAALERAVEVFSAPAGEIMEQQSRCAQAISGLFFLTRQFARRYRQEKRQRKWMDFSDLEHETRRLLCRPNGQPTEIAREVSRRYRQIMVDEYQDSNRLQDSIFFAISQAGRNVFLVGDVKQSIYRFRLADPTIFLEKYQAYPDADQAQDGAPRKVLLSQNFRSRDQILEAVNDICRLCMSREVGDVEYNDQEALRFGRIGADPPQQAVELHCISLRYEQEEHPDKRDAEAAFVAQRIARLLEEENYVPEGDSLRRVEPGDIVILLSTLRTAAGSYVRALKQRGIPVSYEQDGNLLETIEVSSVLSLLQVIDNPHQDIPLYAALASPLLGFTADEIARARVGRRRGDLYDCLRAYGDRDEKTADFLARLQQLRALAARLPADQLLAELYRELDAEAVFGAMDQGKVRAGNLREFLLLAVNAAQNGNAPLHKFLRQIEKRAEQGIPARKSAQAGGCVRIMSIHKSKGLEFPVVILAGLSQQFNAQDLTKSVLLHPELGAATDVVDLAQRVRYPSAAKKAMIQKLHQEMVSEQMRVLYVALTRARDMLIMTYAEAALYKQLEKMAQLLDVLPPVQLASRAGRLGHWVLMCAMQRIEAGELFAVAGRPERLQTSRYPWKICLHEGEDVLRALEEKSFQTPLTRETAAFSVTARELQDWMSFRYGRQELAQVPSKITATQLKGRYLDSEVEDGSSGSLPAPQFRKAVFRAGAQPLRPAQIGTATHLAMQFIRYERCATLAGTQQEIQRLLSEEYLTPEQAAVVSAQKITELFTSELGQRILGAEECLREFKFSILVDAGGYFPGAAGEQIMLQGVTDCCLLEPDGITVIDFKTDRVTQATQEQSAIYYKGQLDAYAKALEEIFHKPVREKILYFFATGQAVSV